MTTTTQAGMTMAKADAADMTALLDVVGIVESMAKGWMPELKDDTPVDKPVDDCFDIENIAHCRYVLDMLLRADQRGSLFRAALV
ncbi:hypothetical protein AWV80_09030 [Cupriavidus sp. UYMU48A]|nr:hypothetical protein AWV80_09030 [Cupriavidus sp. UYMU48A]